MTAGLAQDALTVTLPPGQSASLVTEYMPAAPALVINTSGTGAYLGSNSSVSPSTGVPVGPGASVVWDTEGPLYAIADPAGTAPAVVLATSRISNWEPSPAALAAATAVALEAQGVPNVGQFTTVFPGTLLAANAVELLPVAQYASLIVTVSAALFSSFPVLFRVDWFLDAAQSVIFDAGVFTAMANTAAPGRNVYMPVLMPVIAPYARVTILGTNPLTLSVLGSNRIAPAVRQLNDKRPPAVFTNTPAVLAGVVQQLSPSDGSTDVTTGFNGLCSISLFSPQPGNLYVQFLDALGTTLLYEAANVVTAGNPIIAQVAHPIGRVCWAFQPNANIGAGTISLTVTPCQIS